jgi:hypothetical protein
MEEELYMCFYIIFCCSFCCPSEHPLSSEGPVVTVNPGTEAGNSKVEALKNESDLNKDGLAL